MRSQGHATDAGGTSVPKGGSGGALTAINTAAATTKASTPAAAGNAVSGSGSRFRARKLNVKQHLPILRESDIQTETNDAVAPEQQDALSQALPKVESGVEQKEEKEHHLQAILKASSSAAVGGKVSQLYIPTPEAKKEKSDEEYENLYPKRFREPHTYIRFSSTVEDCRGVEYCMSKEDEQFLHQMNSKRRKLENGDHTGKEACSEEQFELIIHVFEETTQARQPFAAVDNTPVLPWSDMSLALESADPTSVDSLSLGPASSPHVSIDEIARRIYGKEIYEYWKKERMARGNKPLVPRLKTLRMEAGQDNDDSDPYVCFRRREVRQVRKTRGRDAQIVEKLKRLRRELEQGRQLLDWVRQREMLRKDELEVGRKVFEDRANLRKVRRDLGITNDDDHVLLINQRPAPPQKRPDGLAAAANNQQHPGAGGRTASMVRMSGVAGSRTGPDGSILAPLDLEMVYLSEKMKQREEMANAQMKIKFAQHEKWNENFLDWTHDALMGLRLPNEVESEDEENGYLGVQVEYQEKPEPMQQPTPPESTIEESGDDAEATPKSWSVSDRVSWATLDSVKPAKDVCRYRCRRGRGGRMFLDRIPVKRRRVSRPDAVSSIDRFRRGQVDHVSDSEEEYDPYSTEGFRYRDILRFKEQAKLAQAQAQAHAQVQAQAQAQAHAQAQQGQAAEKRHGGHSRVVSINMSDAT